MTLTVTDSSDGSSASVSDPVLTAPAGSTLPIVDPPTTTTVTLTSTGANSYQASFPPGASMVALALGNATIDAGQLPYSTTLDASALSGHDELTGANVLQGGSGFNSLIGGSGLNTLFGTANDSLVGGRGTSSNLFSLLPGAGESVQSGGTNNTLSFAGSTTDITLNLSQVSGSQPTQFAGYDGSSTTGPAPSISMNSSRTIRACTM